MRLQGGFLVLDSDNAKLVWVSQASVQGAEAKAELDGSPDSGGVDADVTVLWECPDEGKFLKVGCRLPRLLYTCRLGHPECMVWRAEEGKYCVCAYSLEKHREI